MSELRLMTVICRVLHTDWTWERIFVHVRVPDSDYSGQRETWAWDAAKRRIREEKIVAAGDVVLLWYAYDETPENSRFFIDRTNLGVQRNARIIVPPLIEPEVK